MAKSMVAPFAGAWIEILRGLLCQLSPPSLPSRERGLKSETSQYRLGKR